jgi:hypothetical protein
MPNFRKLGLLLAGTALSVVGFASIAAADPIDLAYGTTSSDTQAYLSTHSGVAGPTNYITYGINMPTAACFSGSPCVEGPGIPEGGYIGSADRSWNQTVGATVLNLVWGTSNGNMDPAQADVLFSGGYPFDGTGFTPAVNGGSLLSWTGSTDFGPTGIWDGSTPYIGVNSSTSVDSHAGTVYLVFSQPIAGFSALFNFNADTGDTGNVYAFDINGTQIGSNSASINDGTGDTNSGLLLGFLDGGNDIYGIALSDAYSAMTNMSITFLETPANVPEPITLALLGSGLAGLGLVRRYRRK